MFPTATYKGAGQGAWQAGPAVAAVYTGVPGLLAGLLAHMVLLHAGCLVESDPLPAWGLMIAIAICDNLLIGYGARKTEAEGILMLVLPLLVSISFFLIADIDSPRGGLIRVQPQNY